MKEPADGLAVETPIPVRIQELVLQSLEGDQAFDEACVERVRELAKAGRLSHVEEVIRALQGEGSST
jgi:hypothetical protein